MYFFHGVWPDWVKAGFNMEEDIHISTLELVALEWAIQIAAPLFEGLVFNAFCDNKAAVDQFAAFSARQTRSWSNAGRNTT